jgi:hypothetical protein
VIYPTFGQDVSQGKFGSGPALADIPPSEVGFLFALDAPALKLSFLNDVRPRLLNVCPIASASPANNVMRAMTNWKQKLFTTSAWAFYGAVVGTFATVGVGAFGFFNKDREMDIEMVKISLSILAGEKSSIFDTPSSDEKTAPGRAFALRALEKYSGVNIPEEEFTIWQERGTLPSSMRLSTWTDMALSEIEGMRSGGYVVRKKRNGDVEFVRPPEATLSYEPYVYADEEKPARKKK